MTNDELVEVLYLRSQDWQPHPMGPRYLEYQHRIFGVLPDSAGCFYDRLICVGALYITKRATKDEPLSAGLVSMDLGFRSIDDGDVPLLGPIESEDKARRRFARTKEAFAKIQYVPPLIELQKIAANLGLYVNI